MRTLAFWLLTLVCPAVLQAQATLRPGDVFDLRVVGIPAEFAQDVSMQYTVQDNGVVRLPYIGPLQAAGNTVGQFSQVVERQFVAQKIFTNPTVLISLPASARTVSVGGGIKSPGVVPWSPDLTLSEAINRAGGGALGPVEKVKVIRAGKVMRFDLRRSEQDPAQNPRLNPGDEIKVPE